MPLGRSCGHNKAFYISWPRTSTHDNSIIELTWLPLWKAAKCDIQKSKGSRVWWFHISANFQGICSQHLMQSIKALLPKTILLSKQWETPILIIWTFYCQPPHLHCKACCVQYNLSLSRLTGHRHPERHIALKYRSVVSHNRGIMTQKHANNIFPHFSQLIVPKSLCTRCNLSYYFGWERCNLWTFVILLSCC